MGNQDKNHAPPTSDLAEQLSSEQMNYNLSDFALFLSVMKNKIAYESILSIILNEPELNLKDVKVEQVILNQSGKRSIRLDAWALDTEDRQYSTEMQNDTSNDDLRKRSRYYQSLLDSPILKSGKKTRYRLLPATVIIFITPEDIFGQEQAMYLFTEQCEDPAGLPLEDGTTKIFLNMSSKNGRPELVSLLQYMKDTRLDNPEISVKDPRLLKLAEIVDEVKQSEEWEDIHMNILTTGINRGIMTCIFELLSEYGPVSVELQNRILSEADTDTLKAWHKKAAKAESVEDFMESISDTE